MTNNTNLCYLHLITYIHSKTGKEYQYENANIVLVNSFQSGRRLLSDYYLMSPLEGYIPKSLGVYVLHENTLSSLLEENNTYKVEDKFYFHKPFYSALTNNKNIYEQTRLFDEPLSLIISSKETIKEQRSISRRAIRKLDGINEKLDALELDISNMNTNFDILASEHEKGPTYFKRILETKMETRSAIKKCVTNFKAVIESSHKNVQRLEESIKTTLKL